MEYFLIKQDRRYTRTPSIENFNRIAYRWEFTMEKCRKIEDMNMTTASSPERLDYLDILDTQVFLVSKEAKKMFTLYDPTLRYKMFIMLNKKIPGGETGEYYAPIFRQVDCVAPESEFNLDKSHIKKLVLFQRKISHIPVFRVGKIKAEATIVRLDLAERLMRRNLRGFLLEKVEVC